MKIECLARREGGTIVEIGKTRYHFLPDDLGRHVADVTDERHIAIFGLVDGYSAINEPTPTIPDFPKRAKP